VRLAVIKKTISGNNILNNVKLAHGEKLTKA
jgi:hypothetical protein